MDGSTFFVCFVFPRARGKRSIMKEKKNYEQPRLTVVTFKMETGYAASGPLTGTFGLGNSWINEDNDAWSGGAPSGGNRFGGGWTDNGSSAWD